jgi:hypothetical protein
VVGEVFGGQYDGKQSGHFIIDLASLMLNQESRPPPIIERRPASRRCPPPSRPRQRTMTPQPNTGGVEGNRPGLRRAFHQVGERLQANHVRADAWRLCPGSGSSRTAAPATRLYPPAIQHRVADRQRHRHLFRQGPGHSPEDRRQIDKFHVARWHSRRGHGANQPWRREK